MAVAWRMGGLSYADGPVLFTPKTRGLGGAEVAAVPGTGGGGAFGTAGGAPSMRRMVAVILSATLDASSPNSR